MPAAVHALRKELEGRFPSAVPLPRRTDGGLATGIAELDGALPGGGLPRGRLLAWTPGGGATAVLRAACTTAANRGERAAWVDAAGTVTGDDWPIGPVLVRPRTGRQALEAAEELLRSGGIALLVLSGGDNAAGGARRDGIRAAGGKAGGAAVSQRARGGAGDTATALADHTARVRLSHAVREGGAALALIHSDGFLAGLRILTRIRPQDCRWQADAFGEPARMEAVTIRARIRAPGWNRAAEFSLPLVQHDLRLSVEPELVDRRGASR